MPFITVDAPSQWNADELLQWAQGAGVLTDQLREWLQRNAMSGSKLCAPISLEQRRDLIQHNLLTAFIDLLVRFHTHRARSMYTTAEAVAAAAVNGVRSSQPDSPGASDSESSPFVVPPRSTTGAPVVARIAPSERIAPFPTELLPPSVTNMLETLGMVTNMVMLSAEIAAQNQSPPPILALAPPEGALLSHADLPRPPSVSHIDSSEVVELRGLRSPTPVISVRERRRPRAPPSRQTLAFDGHSESDATSEATEDAFRAAPVAADEQAGTHERIYLAQWGEETDDYEDSEAVAAASTSTDPNAEEDLESGYSDPDLDEEEEIAALYRRGDEGRGSEDEDEEDVSEDEDEDDEGSEGESDEDEVHGSFERLAPRDGSPVATGRAIRSGEVAKDAPRTAGSDGDMADEERLDDLDEDELDEYIVAPVKRKVTLSFSGDERSGTSSDAASEDLTITLPTSRYSKRRKVASSGSEREHSGGSKRGRSKRRHDVVSSDSERSDEEAERDDYDESEPEDVEEGLFTPAMIEVLKDHQITGIDFAWDRLVKTEWVTDSRTVEARRGCILAHAMGAGKTLQAIILSHLYLKRQLGRLILIVVPSQLETNWRTEIRMWRKRLALTRRMRLYTITGGNPARTFAEWERTGGIMLLSVKRFCRFYPPPPKPANAAAPAASAAATEETAATTAVDAGDAMDVDASAPDSAANMTAGASAPVDASSLAGPGVAQPLAEGVNGTEMGLDDPEAAAPADGQVPEDVTSVPQWRYPKPDLLMVDEAHQLKNPKTQGYRSVEAMRDVAVLLMTGSPLQNHLEEYHSMARLIVPNLLPDIRRFRELYVHPINRALQDIDDLHAVREAKRKLNILRKKMNQVLHRVTRQDIMGKDFDEYVIVCRQSDLQQAATRAIKQDLTQNGLNLLEAVQRNGHVAVHPAVAWEYACNTRPDKLRLVVRAPGASTDSATDTHAQARAESPIIDYEADYEEPADGYIPPPVIEEPQPLAVDGAAQPAPPIDRGVLSTPIIREARETMGPQAFMDPDLSPKVMALIDLVRLIALDRNEKVLIFVEHKEALRFVNQVLSEHLKVRCLSLYGDVSKRRRDKNIRAFMRKDKYKVLTLTKQSGGVGLNLTAATRVIICEASWNPVNDEQAICRAHRLGQLRRVYAYHLLGFNTLESNVFKRGIRKNLLRRAVVDNQPLDRPTEAARIQALLEEEPEPAEPPAAQFEDEVLNDLVRAAPQRLIAIKRPSEYSQRDVFEEPTEYDETEEAHMRNTVMRARTVKATPARPKPKPKPRSLKITPPTTPSLKLTVSGGTTPPPPASPGPGAASADGGAPPLLVRLNSSGGATPPSAQRSDSPTLVSRIVLRAPSSPRSSPSSPGSTPPPATPPPSLPKISLSALQQKYL